MNFLAHLWLTEQAHLPLAGAVLGDAIRGRLDGRCAPALERSIRLHRRIDALTDAHPCVAAARARFAPGARRYAGIVLDLLYDHCLALDWPHYSAEPLADFARRAAREVAAERGAFSAAGLAPPRAAAFERLLCSYQEESALERALARVAARSSRPERLLQATRTWREHRPAARATLPVLLADLRAAAE
jgi:acyl carrier protein phosphodiesterase